MSGSYKMVQLECSFMVPVSVGDIIAIEDVNLDEHENLEHQDHQDQGDLVEPYEHAEFETDDESKLHPDMNKWMLMCNTESEDEDYHENSEVNEAAFGKHVKRCPAVDSRPEYQRLRELGLAVKPSGCSLGIHPSARVWRASSSVSSHYSRSFEGSSGRSPWQALLRVMELMLESFLETNSKEKLVKHQLSRIKKLRAEEPAHKD